VKKGAWAYPERLPKFFEYPYYSGMGKATNFKGPFW